MLSGFEIVSGLADGASAMPAKWNKPVFSFRFDEGRISCPPLHISSRAAPQITCYRHCGSMAQPKRVMTQQAQHWMAVSMPALRATRGQAWPFLYSDEHAPWD